MSLFSRMHFRRGAVGIGTLIIFIAMVLVAAIAAAVLINVSGILQQRAMQTGKEAIAQVSGNLLVQNVMGTTNSGMTNIENITVFIGASAGAGRIDISQLIIRVGNNNNQSTLTYNSTSAQAGLYFNATEIRDPTSLFTPATPVIDGSSLIQLNVLPASTVYLPPRSRIHLEFIPEHGVAVAVDTTAPSSYSTQLQVLYP